MEVIIQKIWNGIKQSTKFLNLEKNSKYNKSDWA